MIDMLMKQATTVRKEWSAFCDSATREKPIFIKRTRDKMWFSDLETMYEILQAYQFTVMKYHEEDGSITLSLNEIDLVENGKYETFSHSPNRKGHIPYIFKALIIDDPHKIGDMLQCQDRKN